MKVYVASSWRNSFQPIVVKALLKDGHSVYDFRHPEYNNYGFRWSEINTNWRAWDTKEYITALDHQLAITGFERDMQNLRHCEACVYVMPCGPSASMELGWACGAGKKTVVYIPELKEPDLMIKMADLITDNFDCVRKFLR